MFIAGNFRGLAYRREISYLLIFSFQSENIPIIKQSEYVVT